MLTSTHMGLQALSGFGQTKPDSVARPLAGLQATEPPASPVSLPGMAGPLVGNHNPIMLPVELLLTLAQYFSGADAVTGEKTVDPRRGLIARRAAIGQQHAAQAALERERRRQACAAGADDEHVIGVRASTWRRRAATVGKKVEGIGEREQS